MSNRVIICDFDGTITETDNIIAIMKRFAPPEWDALKNGVLSQEISIQEGVGKMFQLLPSSSKDEIVKYILDHAEIRSGFRDFVQFTKDKNIPLYIVSGGIDFFVYPLLEGLIEEEQIYCNKANFSNDHIQIEWPYSCDKSCTNDCGCCKTSLIRKLTKSNQEKIVIGDSITDLQAAKLADYVIARDLLLEKCQDLHLPHQSFITFFDVINILENLEEVRA
ncbi:2-hydroxy-3-keto-5-methylthiopentenyl-1-phosphate phosphatase [Metabacillus endolithicus]|uniref:2-hydroxy-3-keto-5-methylthiopentenyl-1-phosphate phosphatase n=1 Tax=Metabacillus endolithicus TaxID=1535204 RepID=A0ABW5BSV4_9BACI|nr:2-hydroxy-3-keto-5-methylthiopentenyl-1-phosphate phosphatase [Metabacillus endolithicus]UPG62980.1 2-hydroxy-3-keto-5-methylthiopentenyl-1-phosphate phosphatase [Metabacillus endolithicus]